MQSPVQLVVLCKIEQNKLHGRHQRVEVSRGGGSVDQKVTGELAGVRWCGGGGSTAVAGQKSPRGSGGEAPKCSPGGGEAEGRVEEARGGRIAVESRSAAVGRSWERRRNSATCGSPGVRDGSRRKKGTWRRRCEAQRGTGEAGAAWPAAICFC